MKNLLLFFAFFYSHLVIGQDFCPDFKPNKKNVKIIKFSPDIFLGSNFEDFIVIPNLSAGLDFSLGSHWGIGGSIGAGFNHSFTDPFNYIYDTYAMFKIETRYFPYLTFNKLWYGIKVTVLSGKQDPIIPLPTIHIGYMQKKMKNCILDYTVGAMYFGGGFFVDTGISWGFIYSKNKRVRA
jgi:hypothetical protein